MMKDVKKMPADVIEMYSKFYRNFKWLWFRYR
jgi:hypothetical protein